VLQQRIGRPCVVLLACSQVLLHRLFAATWARALWAPGKLLGETMQSGPLLCVCVQACDPHQD
jgi:hypothetical protein